MVKEFAGAAPYIQRFAVLNVLLDQCSLLSDRPFSYEVVDAVSDTLSLVAVRNIVGRLIVVAD